MDSQDRTVISERIRNVAKNTDGLIAKLDTLTNRIETARANENHDLVEYYENQFAEASVEFMDNVETILDGWYELRGERRPSADEEMLTPEVLDEIHSTVVGIVQGLAMNLPEDARASGLREKVDLSSEGIGKLDAAIAPAAPETPPHPRRNRRKGPGNKVDLTG